MALTRRASSIIAGTLLALSAAATAGAQDQLVVGGRFISAMRNFGQVLGPGPRVDGPQIFGAGRFAVSTVTFSPSVTVIDGRTGTSRDVPGRFVAVDRAPPVVFVARPFGFGAGPPDSVWAVDVVTGIERRVFAATAATLLETCAHASSANVLYCAAQRPDGDADITAVDVAALTARVVAVTRLTAPLRGLSWSPLTTPDGSRLYFDALEFYDPVTGAARFELALLNTTTGHLSRHPAVTGSRTFDDATERVVVVSSPLALASTAVSLYTKDLAPIVLDAPIGAFPTVVVSPHTKRLYVFGFTGPLNGPLRERMWVFDATIFAPLAPPVDRVRTDVRAGTLGASFVALLTAPGPPRDVSATVSGSTVTLTWTNVGAAGGFVLEAGLGPGRTDLQLHLDVEPRVTFSGVPPGTYYLRLRGGNAFGGGRASEELRVTVP